MPKRTINDFPNSKEIIESPYTLDFVRTKLSGLFESDISLDGNSTAMLKLIFTLSNEIAELKSRIEVLENTNS